jgi:hypothetical protein
MIVAVKLDRCTFYIKIRIWPYLDRINKAPDPDGFSDVNLVITWSRNPHAKTTIAGKASKSGLIGVWHKDNFYLGTNTIGNGKPPPNEYWFANEKYKDDATKLIVLW